MSNAKKPWSPARSLIMLARRAASCLWCGRRIELGSEIAYYPEERQSAHADCHREVCP